MTTMNKKTEKAYRDILAKVDAVSKPLPLVDYHELLTELADEIDARLEVIKNQSGLV